MAHALLGQPLALQGAYQEAVDSAKLALRLSPRDRLAGTYASMVMAMVHFAARQYSDCITWARNVIEKSPGFASGRTTCSAQR